MAAGLGGTVRAEGGLLPGLWSLHPTMLVNPGCAPALIDKMDGSVDIDAGRRVLAEPEAYPDLVPDVTEVFIRRPVIGFDKDAQTFIYGPPPVWFDKVCPRPDERDPT